MRDDAIDFSSLNDNERFVLRLLAQGHTAKSIAARQETTVNAVNERLREARRKTSVGSSRELARLLRSQENRDEKMVMVGAEPPSLPSETDGVPSVARRDIIGGAIVMFFVAAIGLVLLVHPQASGPISSDQSTIAEFDQSNPAALQRRLRAEPRDPAWADGAEKELKGLYSKVRNITGLTVRCGTTLCEVSGGIGPDIDTTSTDGTMKALQSSHLAANVRRIGFGEPLSNAFRSGSTDPSHVSFAIFWPRVGSN